MRVFGSLAPLAPSGINYSDWIARNYPYQLSIIEFCFMGYYRLVSRLSGPGPY
jgi:hypothetical protein